MKKNYRFGAGQGVASLMKNRDVEQEESNRGMIARAIPLNKIIKDKDQVRSTFDPRSIEELAQSIKDNGLIQPISVYESSPGSDEYIILAGERRYRAYEHLGRDSILAFILEEPEDRNKLLFMQFAENLHREDLNQFDIAHQIQNMLNLGLSQSDIAKGLNKGNSFVSRHLAILRLPDDVKRLAEEDRASSEALVNIKNAYEINPTAVNHYIDEVLKTDRKVTTIDSRDVLSQVKETQKLVEEKESIKAKPKKEPKSAIKNNNTEESLDIEQADSALETRNEVALTQNDGLSEGIVEKVHDEIADEPDPEVQFYKRVHVTKFMIKVEFFTDDMDEMAKGFLVTDRIPFDDNYAYVVTDEGDGEQQYHYVKIDDIQFIGVKESDKIMKS